MTVSFVSAATGVDADSITFSSHQSGDLIVVLAGGITGTNIVIPSGWFVVGIRVASPRNLVMAAKYAASSGETSGTWTNAVVMASAVYRDTSNIVGVGGPILSAATNTTVSYGAIIASTDGGTAGGKAPTALILPIAGGQVASRTLSLSTPPTGYTFRSGKAHASSATEIALFDYAAEVSSIVAQTTTIGSSTGWATIVNSLFDGGYAKTGAVARPSHPLFQQVIG